jgi:hypothetical protein
MGRPKLGQHIDDLAKLRLALARTQAALGASDQRFIDFVDYVKGWCDEMGQQLFGVHVVQKMLLDKVGISNDDVEVQIKARAEALAEQERILREAAEKAHADAETAKANLATAETTGQAEIPPEVADGQAPAGSTDSADLPS